MDMVKHKTVVFIHTIKPLLNVFDDLAIEILPGVKTWHILDELMLEIVRRRGKLHKDDAERLLEHVTEAEKIGADALLVTCSTISPCVDDVQSQISIPVLKIDQPMIEEAIKLGINIGVVATNQTTLAPTKLLLEQQAKVSNKEIETKLKLVDDALEALLSGNGEYHDNLVKEVVMNLSPQVDVVILAQASMARVLQVIPEPDRVVPILTSPHLALRKIRELFLSG